MTKETSREKWEKFWEEKADVEEVYSNEERLIRAFMKLGDVKGKTILEVGAGTGRDSFRLAQMAECVYVLDYAENAIRIIDSLNKSSPYKVVPLRGDAFKLPFRDESFDIVFHQGLLEHFRNPKDILKENYRVLKSGGFVIVDVPQRWHIYTLVKHILISIDKWFAGWETEYSFGELKRLVESCGFEFVTAVGEWMYPSFFYRSFREGLKKIGIRLPLYPPKVPLFWRIRKLIRESLRDSYFALNTGIAIGIVARKR